MANKALTDDQMHDAVVKFNRSLVNKGTREERREILKHARLKLGVDNELCKWIEGRAGRVAKKKGGLG